MKREQKEMEGLLFSLQLEMDRMYEERAEGDGWRKVVKKHNRYNFREVQNFHLFIR
jgi:hypothetical protein